MSLKGIEKFFVQIDLYYIAHREIKFCEIFEIASTGKLKLKVKVQIKFTVFTEFLAMVTLPEKKII